MHNSAFDIEERRIKVRRMIFARAMTEQEVARKLGVDQATISRDVKAIKEMSRRFIYELAKGDIAFEYKRALEILEEVQREAWMLYDKEDSSARDKLMALRRIIECTEAKAKLLDGGPAVLSMQSMEDRLSQVEAVEDQDNVMDQE